MLAQAQRHAEGLRRRRRNRAEAEGRLPDDARGLYLDAQILDDRGRKDEAIAAFERAR